MNSKYPLGLLAVVVSLSFALGGCGVSGEQVAANDAIAKAQNQSNERIEKARVEANTRATMMQIAIKERAEIIRLNREAQAKIDAAYVQNTKGENSGLQAAN